MLTETPKEIGKQAALQLKYANPGVLIELIVEALGFEMGSEEWMVAVETGITEYERLQWLVPKSRPSRDQR